MTATTDLRRIIAERVDLAVDRAADLADEIESRNGGLSAQIELEAALEDLDRYSRMADHVGVVKVRHEPSIYRPDGEYSFFVDAALQRTSAASNERLERHQAEMRTLGELERRDVNTGTLNGLVPPTHLIDELVPANKVQSTVWDWLAQPLPATGMDITLPTITAGVDAVVQANQNATVTSGTLTMAASTTPVETVMVTLAMATQALERAGAGVDRLIATELAAELAATRESQLFTGLGTSGQFTGLLVAAGTGAVTYTDADPTVLELLTKLGALASAVNGARPDVFVFAGRRLNWLLSQAGPNTIAPAITDPQPGDPPGTAVRIFGIPALCSTGMPTNLGTGTNEDAIIAMHRDAVVLLADTPRLSFAQRDPNGGGSAAPQTYWLSLTQYATVNIRRKTSIAKMTGTGLNVTAA